ncbi:MAG: flagellar basal body P-ring protein FlgI [Mariprofundales bacterium]|nr:flagellar basal body P-ring protein FlgI [Mariprofundales bacterium]
MIKKQLRQGLWMVLPLVMIMAWPLMASAERIKDLATVGGVRANALIGYGIVVGLNGTGDDSISSPFTINSIAAMLERFGINIRTQISKMKPANVAAVMLTAELPAFARPGQTIDVTVSSMGDAKSLRGGTLLIAPLTAGDRKVYAVAQGEISIGGFSVAGKSASVTKGHPTAGRIPNGARVEIAAPKGLQDGQNKIILSLRNPDFTTATRMRQAINAHFGKGMAKAVDAGTVEVWNPQGDAVSLIAELEQLRLTTDHKAMVVVDERTGTIVMGEDVTIDKVAVAHGNISVTVTEKTQISQPNAFGGGQTKTTNESGVSVKEAKAKFVVLPRQVTLSSLVSALNSVGAAPSDLIAVLQAIKAAGALHAELRVL